MDNSGTNPKSYRHIFDIWDYENSTYGMNVLTSEEGFVGTLLRNLMSTYHEGHLGLEWSDIEKFFDKLLTYLR